MINRTINELLPLSQLVFIIGLIEFCLQRKIYFLKKNFFLAESGYGKSSLIKLFLKNLKSGISKICIFKLVF